MRVFLKLGGSLITDKDKPYAARRDVVARIAQEIKTALRSDPELQLLLGHGSGSFGHVAASHYGTRDQVSSPEQWRGFQEVWYAARLLNQIVLEELQQAELPVISFPPSAMVSAAGRKIAAWNLQPLHSAMQQGLIPVVYGDVVFDRNFSGIILSTEDLFLHLIDDFKPDRILIAGKEPGVWADFPTCSRLIPIIDSASFAETRSKIFPSASLDVTGGMLAKVQLMIEVVQQHPDLSVSIFSGEENGHIALAIAGQSIGTIIQE